MPRKVERMKPPYIPLYVRDLFSSMWVDQMDDQQFGWYMRMLLRSWEHDVPCHIPNTVDMILIFAKAKKDDFDAKGWIVLQRFETTEDGKFIFNRRLLTEYEGIIGKYKANAKAAKKRWSGNTSGMRPHTDRSPDAVRTVSQPEPEPEPEPDTEPKAVKAKSGARKTQMPEVLPDWLPKERFEAYIEMRKTIKRPMTANAIKLAIGKLENLKARGHPPEAVLNQSIEHSWNGLFEIREEEHVKVGANGHAGSNGKQPVSKAAAKERRIVDNVLRYRAATAGTGSGAGGGPVAVPRDGSTGVRGLDGEPEIIPPGQNPSRT